VTLETDDSLGEGSFLVGGEVRAADGGGPVGSLSLPNGDRVSLGEDPVTIGRLAECDIPLADSNVSRRHAEVRRQDDHFVIVDLGSTNGTRINGAGVKERALNDGDEITIGSTTLVFEAS
jgi:pSer/pThr/pTyr-binding forkhead associated (FHA) protein